MRASGRERVMIRRLRPGLAALGAICGGLACGSSGIAQDHAGLVGVWKTVDASSDEGRQQGGIAFRSDGTGEFFSATFVWPATSIFVETGLIPSTSQSADVIFSYSVAGQELTTQMNELAGMPGESPPVAWTIEWPAGQLKLSRKEDVSIWITLAPVWFEAEPDQ